MSKAEKTNISDEQENNDLSHETPQDSLFDSLKKELENIPDLETKLHRIIECMQTSISQTGSPNFRTFWEARKLCLQLFKESIAPSVRALYWTKYTEISQEAYRLKEILDEQSAFATEQIDMAISDIEKSIAEMAQNIEKQEEIKFPEYSELLARNFEKYNQLQREINLLNSQASRINAMRKELIRTQMRVKQKNKFFKRLSALGDSVFPRRKALIKEVSDLFVSDVTAFAKECFPSEIQKGPLFELREEIKSLQNIAKILTLNSQAFAATRKELSQCWDQMKEVEKDRKREKSEHYQEILTSIQEFGTEVAEGKLSIHDAENRVDEIFAKMKEKRLGREEVAHLKGEIVKAEQPIMAQKHEEEAKRKEEALEKLRQREERLEKLRQSIADLGAEVTTADPAQLMDRFAALEKEIGVSEISSPHRQELRRKLIPLRDAVIDKVERMRLDQSGEDIVEIRNLLKDRKERRQKVKEQYEAYRKAAGGSGLGFDQMMKLNEQVAEEKKRLEKLDESIKELEKKLNG